MDNGKRFGVFELMAFVRLWEKKLTTEYTETNTSSVVRRITLSQDRG